MRNDDAPLLSRGSGIREVGHILADLAALERGEHILLVDESVAGRVDDDDTALHHRNRLGVDHTLRGFESGNVDGDEIAGAVNRLDVLAVRYGMIKIPGRVDGQIGIVAVNLHAELNAGVGDLLTDRAETDDTELLALDFSSGESLLGLLGRLVDGRILDVSLNPFDTADDVAAREKHRGDNELLDAVGVCARGVENDDAVLGVIGVGNVVYARTGARDGENFGTFRQSLHLGAAHEYGLGFGEVLRAGVVLGEIIQTAVGDRIQTCIFVVHFISSVELSWNIYLHA